MLHASILALLATMAPIGPLPSTNLLLEDCSPSAPSSYITACEAADNCETYIEPTTGRPSIRFKTGMEPGTEDYISRLAKSKTKRQSGYPQTQVTVGDTTIYWGCGIDPVATLNNVSCATWGQCIDTDSFSTFIGFGVYSSPSTLEATIAVSITRQKQQNGFCSTFSSIVGVITGVFGPEGAGLAAIFGTISAACSL